MDPLQIPPTMAPPHLIKNERCLKCLITCNFRPWPRSTGGPSQVHKLPHVLILFCILRAIIDFVFCICICIFWTADKNTKVSMMINERPKSGWKRTWQNSGLTRNRTLACDERLNSGGSRGGTGGPGSHPYFSTKMRPEVPKKCFSRPPPPPFLRVWMTAPPHLLSQGLDPALLNLPQGFGLHLYHIFWNLYWISHTSSIHRMWNVIKTYCNLCTKFAPLWFVILRVEQVWEMQAYVFVWNRQVLQCLADSKADYRP